LVFIERKSEKTGQKHRTEQRGEKQGSDETECCVYSGSLQQTAERIGIGD